MNYFLNVPFTRDNLIKFLSEFKCQRCKESCCLKVDDGIVLLPDEVERLAILKGMSKSKFKEAYTVARDGKRFMVCPCPFYKVGEDCTIHRNRPRVCQQFPFNRVYRKYGVDYMTVNVDCPSGKIIGEKYGIKPESVGVKV